MNRANIIFLMVAVLFAGLLTFGVYHWSKTPRVDETTKQIIEAAERISVLVATKDLGPGSRLAYSDMRWQIWPKDALSSTFAIKGARKMADFKGAITRMHIAQGQPITDKMVVQPETAGLLSILVSPGMRAFSFDVDSASSVAGFVFPGDYVDVILTYAFKNKKNEFGSKVILENIKVLALDQQITRDEGSKAKVAKTVTLEVSASQAQKLAIAKKIGKLSMSLRSISGDQTKSKGQKVTRSDDVVKRSYLHGKTVIIRGSKIEGN